MKRIEQMYAFITTDPEDDTEGVIGFQASPTSGMMPMVGADMERVEQLRPLALSMARASGVEVRVVRFEVRTEIEVLS